MGLIKRLTKQGNSYSLIIDKALIDLLGITPETQLEITTTDGKSLNIRPLTAQGRQKIFQSALEDVNTKHSEALKRLAK